VGRTGSELHQIDNFGITDYKPYDSVIKVGYLCNISLVVSFLNVFIVERFWNWNSTRRVGSKSLNNSIHPTGLTFTLLVQWHTDREAIGCADNLEETSFITSEGLFPVTSYWGACLFGSFDCSFSCFSQFVQIKWRRVPRNRAVLLPHRFKRRGVVNRIPVSHSGGPLFELWTGIQVYWLL